MTNIDTATIIARCITSDLDIFKGWVAIVIYKHTSTATTRIISNLYIFKGWIAMEMDLYTAAIITTGIVGYNSILDFRIGIIINSKSPARITG